MAAQSIRRSQFITTYGPGAILEGPDGPRIIPTLEQSDLFIQNRRPSDYEITELRLSQALLNGAGILRLPSNAEIGEPDGNYVYNTLPFPSWALCVEHERLYHKTTSNNYRACPQCAPLPSAAEAWRRVRRQAIRFIRSCPNGHMDDVDWIGIIPHTQPNCTPSWLHWSGGGGALRDVNIQCPLCSASINLGIAYSREWSCSGRYPEQGNVRPGCTLLSKIVQRGAANLRISEIQTALTIPPRASALHRLLELTIVRTVLVTQPITSKAALVNALRALAQQNLLHPATITEVERYGESDILSAIGDVVSSNAPQTISDLRLQEYYALRHAAVNGAPPQQSSRPDDPPQFEVIQTQTRSVIGPTGHSLRITPVNRLRVVMVQTGYRRLDPLNNLVDRVYDDGQRMWYPGVELFGEGIFIDLLPAQDNGDGTHHFVFSGDSAHDWYNAWSNTAIGLPEPLSDRHFLHPVFVWWHTLAHRLINALSVDSGYSSASIRERVFVEVDASGRGRGGVLLYTAQPGGDGTLGGLVALVPEFERVLESAFRNIDACSNDPLCGEETFSKGKYNGAACYACALISETSCEHRNMGLDRSLLTKNMP